MSFGHTFVIFFDSETPLLKENAKCDLKQQNADEWLFKPTISDVSEKCSPTFFPTWQVIHNICAERCTSVHKLMVMMIILSECQMQWCKLIWVIFRRLNCTSRIWLIICIRFWSIVSLCTELLVWTNCWKKPVTPIRAQCWQQKKKRN